MSEVPEEVVVAIEADDRASPTLTGFGRSLVLLGANVAYITRAFGLQDTAINTVVSGILTLGHVVRALNAAKTTLAVLQSYLNTLTIQEAGATSANTVSQITNLSMTNILTAAKLRLAAAATAAKIAMIGSPLGLALLGLGIAGAAVGGYMMGQRGGAGASSPMPTQVNMRIDNADFRTRKSAEEQVRETADMVHKHFRTYP